MRKSINMLMGLCMLLGAYSCNDGNIGSSIADTTSHVIMDSSFTITGTTVANTSLQARSSALLLGEVTSKGYGTLVSDVVSEMMPVANVDTAGTTANLIDSCRIVMRVTSSGFTGDSIVPMRLNVYRLNRELPNPIYSDFKPEGYYSKNDLIGSVTYSANSLQNDSVFSDGYRQIYVPTPVSFARELFNKFVADGNTFSTPTNFAKYFPGIYIANSYGRGRVMNFYDTSLEVFYRAHETSSSTGNDTIVSKSQVYLASTPEVAINNNVKLTVDDSVKQLVAAGNAIVMGPAGYEVKVKFPIKDILKNLDAEVGLHDLAVVNTLALSLPVEAVKNTYDVEPPKYLLMVKEGKKNEFFDGDSLTNDLNSFYAAYSSSTKSYEFTGLRDYLLDVLTRVSDKSGNIDYSKITDDDINFVITPIDVTTYTSSSSYSSYYYYYYYGSSSSSSGTTTVTKIAPSISYPSIGKLLLNKAKIKLTYSKQSI